MIVAPDMCMRLYVCGYMYSLRNGAFKPFLYVYTDMRILLCVFKANHAGGDLRPAWD